MTLLLASRILAVATVLVSLTSFVTAGIYLQTDDGSAENVHGTASIVYHVVTGLLTAALALLARSTGRGWWAAVAAATIFGYSFIQGLLSDTLAYHVTGGFLLATTPIVLVTWLLIGNAATRRSAAS